ncbi:TetR/AcrR family transcriptional regulator [Burkholderia sp. GS2Y]|uniref:TetR/AcrR family transcriptional regulator n=1 Tax=Burkholderia theae TaxID=3143496 RepID=A0ABU9WRP0_9BURK
MTANTPRVRRTQAERVAESDRRLMEAAIRLIARVGYTHTTLESIGIEAGYSRGLVQHRFGSKDQMLEELVNKIATDQRERLLARLQGLRGMDALLCEIDCYLEGMDTPPERARAFYMLMQESLGPAPHIRTAFAAISARWHRALARQIEVGQEAGQIRPDVDPAAEARLLIATLRGLRMQSMLDPHTSNIAKSIDSLKCGLRARLLQPL